MTFSRVAYMAAAQLGIASLGMLGYVLAENPAGWILPLMLGAWLFSAICFASEFIPMLRNGLRFIIETPVLAWLLVLGLLVVWVRGLWAASIAFLPPLWTYIPFALLWVWLALAFLLMISQSKPRGFVIFVGRVWQKRKSTPNGRISWLPISSLSAGVLMKICCNWKRFSIWTST